MNSFKYFLLFILLLIKTEVLAQQNREIQPSFAIFNTSFNLKPAGSRELAFDIIWDSVWRFTQSEVRRNSLWVFLKFRKYVQQTSSYQNWKHGSLSKIQSEYSIGQNNGNEAEFSTVSDGKGVFISRKLDGSSPVNWQSVKINWDCFSDGILPADSIDFKILAVEMVYIPEGSFYIGDGVSPGRFHSGSIPGSPYLVNSTNVNCSNSTGGLWADTSRSLLPGGTLGPYPWDRFTGTLQQEYPTGFKTFYLMKYEISMGLYSLFLNMLTPLQQSNRFPLASDFTSNPACPNKCRFTIDLNTQTAIYSTATPSRSMNWLYWEDAIALADWAGLRPMTELEFEKSCRGNNQIPVASEYAWGSANITSITGFDGVDGSGTELPVPFNSNTLYNRTIQGPVKIGIFDKRPSRELTGASYYGAVDMSGNNVEMVISLGNQTGRSFTNKHGDGELTDSGSANVNTWPRALTYTAQIINGGWGYKGGDFWNPELDLRVSARNVATFAGARRLFGLGFRGVRSENRDSIATHIKIENRYKAEGFQLERNFPNPFFQSTQISFTIPIDCPVDLRVYDILGREIAIIIDSELKAGKHKVQWDGRNILNADVTPGIYLLKLAAGEFRQSNKMILIK